MADFLLQIPDEEAMQTFGESLAAFIKAPFTVFFEGNLGAGKTTLIRGILRGFGFEGKVKSPTYTIVEPYEVNGLTLFHFDLYRVNDPDELDFIGINDYFHSNAICFIEWPKLGRDKLPIPDVTCYIETTLPGRSIKLTSHTQNGITFLNNLS